MNDYIIFILVLLAVALAPMLHILLKPIIKIPIVVCEMIFGLILGPAILNLVEPTSMTTYLSTFGVIMLFFVAGYDTDFKALGKTAIIKGSVSWIVCLILALAAGIGVASVFHMDGVTTPVIISGIFLGAGLVSTGLGTIFPMMQDANETDTKIGRAVISSGVIGQFAPLVAIAVLARAENPLISFVQHLIFIGIVGFVLFFTRKGFPKFLSKVQTETLYGGGQFSIREQSLIIVIIVGIALLLGVDRLIGAYGAGMIVRSMLTHSTEKERLTIESKIKGLSYGIFIPIFFVMAGVTFDLQGLISTPSALALIPLFIILKLLVRGLPGSFTLPKKSTMQERMSTSLLVGTGLAAVIVMSNLGVEYGALSTVMAAAMIGAAKFSALVFPTVGLSIANKVSAKEKPIEAVNL